MSHTVKIVSASPSKETFVTGHDSEFSDISNPSGAIYDDALFINATTARGDRFTLTGVSFGLEEKDKALALCAKIEDRGEITLERWGRDLPVYGSAAWEEEEGYRIAAHRSDPANPEFH
jgi:hypothetical protein